VSDVRTRPRALLVPPLLFAALALCAAGTRPATGQPPKAESKPEKKADSKPDAPKETLSETQHTLRAGDLKLEYKATAGTLVLKDDEGKAKASMFFVAYTRTDGDAGPRRPITFTFNGGPGSSSVWLHLGAFGPKRVLMKDNGDPLPGPYRLADNDATILDLTDLVFIDPVSTGFSRPAPGQSGKQFHGVQEDVQSVGEFIRLYTTKFGRWGSPKFLAGESYGTTRAANLANYLQDHDGLNLTGVLLISAVLNFQTIRFDDGNDLTYPLFLPTYTATAWYHKKLAPELQADLRKTLDEAQRFAEGEYNAALMKGNKLSAAELASVRAKLARYTGLSEDFVGRNNLRVEIFRFAKELLRDQHRTVGRYDSRLVGLDTEPASDRPEYDPSYAAVQGTFTAAMNGYLRAGLKYDRDNPYEILTGKVQPWDFGTAKNRYLNVSRPLKQALTKNRSLRVFVANGYYDLATPYFATEYTFNHLGLEPALADHVTMAYYDAGHMMYIDRACHRKLKKDVAAFYAKALGK
jgi:carboxypeptidase C (cathepsin A)